MRADVARRAPPPVQGGIVRALRAWCALGSHARGTLRSPARLRRRELSPVPAPDAPAALRRRPQHTPRATLGAFLWVFGLYAALFAAAPAAITPLQEAAFEHHMRVVRPATMHAAATRQAR